MQTITVSETSASLRRILFVAELVSDTNGVQTIDLGDIGSGDTFTLTFDGQTTSAISYNATPATQASNIDTALEALSNIAASDLTVANTTGANYTVTFAGTLAATNVPLMTITPTGFTPGGITMTTYGGIAGGPARGLTFATDEISLSRNGAAAEESAGTVTEIGDGRYYYEATAGEVATQGFLALVIVRADIATVFPAVQIVPSSSALGAPIIRSATAQAGAAGTITLDSGASATSSYYVPTLCYLRSGTGAGQARLVYDYDGATKLASIEPDWITPPSSDTVFDLLPVTPLMADVLRANHDTLDTFGDVALPGDIADEVESRTLTSDVVSISGSVAAADKLESHSAAVLQAVIGVGSSATSIVLNDASGINGGAPSATNDAYNGRVLVITSGALAGQAQAITDYVGSTVTLTTGAFTGSPAEGVTGVIV